MCVCGFPMVAKKAAREGLGTRLPKVVGLELAVYVQEPGCLKGSQAHSYDV